MSLDIYLQMEVDTGGPEPHTVELFSANYTHNVTPMWSKAGVYEALYKSHGKKAGEVLDALHAGLNRMEANPEDYTPLNPENGWGSYKTAVPWLRKLVAAFEEHPKATIRVSA